MQKLTDAQRTDAIKMIALGMPQNAIAEYFGVSRQYINHLYFHKCVGRKRKSHYKIKRQKKTTEQVYGQSAAHKLTSRAIREGVLIPEPCEMCGLFGKGQDGVNLVNAHHDDYNKPLEVRWLCRKHHNEWHKNNFAIQCSLPARLPNPPRRRSDKPANAPNP